MSRWTHITSCISVDTFKTSLEPEKMVQDYMKNAPKITGSEGDADIFINIPSGFNVYISHNCKHCTWKDTLRDVVVDGEEYEECDAPDGYDCSAEYQTCVVISIQGDLRDKGKEETEKEFNEFLKYIEKAYSIRDYSINIKED